MPLCHVVGPVLVEGQSSWVLSVGVATARGRGVGELIQPPVFFGKTSRKGFGELQVRLDPGNVVQLVLEEQDALPKVPVPKRNEWDTLEDKAETIVNVTAVRNYVHLAVEAS